MKLKDIKIGEAYNARVKVLSIEKGLMEAEIATALIDEKGKPLVPDVAYFTERDIAAFSPINPYEPLMLDTINRIPENTPKYDPFRKFRKGDKVRVRKIHGNLPQCRYNGMIKVKEGDYCTIHEKEHRNCYWVTIPSGGNWCLDAAYLELVTPVEELEPYEVECDGDNEEYSVTCRNKFVCIYPYDADSLHTKEQAKAAAEAERDRLNAERRKEQS